ncbi:MAG TPA: hypothetical protein VGM57_09830 [Pseudolabrys sp.]
MPILPHAQNAPMVDAMTNRMLSVFAAAMIAGLVVYDSPADIQQVPEPIDFARLNSQAAAALQSLQASQAQRIAPQADDPGPASPQ